eukprot:6405968-Prorocentrum_lima.AAC.1
MVCEHAVVCRGMCECSHHWALDPAFISSGFEEAAKVQIICPLTSHQASENPSSQAQIRAW